MPKVGYFVVCCNADLGVLFAIGFGLRWFVGSLRVFGCYVACMLRVCCFGVGFRVWLRVLVNFVFVVDFACD